MITKFSAIFGLVVAIFLMASAPVFAARGNCGAGAGRGNDTKPAAGCPPNKHGVPGPIAGAGLPFLIAGVIAYRRRRKTGSDDAE